MFEQLVFTTDPEYFPKSKMREIVSGLHAKNQHYSTSRPCGTSSINRCSVVMMVDPAIGVRPGISGAYDRGSAAGIWMKEPGGADYLGSKYFSSVIGFRPDIFHVQFYGPESRFGLIGSTRPFKPFGTMNSGSFSIRRMELISTVCGST